ncbi:MAG: HlyD family type I secretion periplasmic adaptor subunit [Pararhodobacter sp.]
MTGASLPPSPDAAPDPGAAWGAGRAVALGLLATFLVVAGFGGWAATARLQGAVVAPARVAVSLDRQVVQHPQGGVVTDILVYEGQPVSAGAPLMRLDAGIINAELAILDSHLVETLARLAAERDDARAVVLSAPLAAAMTESEDARALVEGQIRLFEGRAAARARQRAQISQRQRQARAQIAGLAAQVHANEAEAALVAQDLDRQHRLVEQGLSQTARLIALQREAARLAGARGALDAESARLRGVLAELAQQAMALDADHRTLAETEMRDLGVHALELAQRRIALLDRAEGLTLRAPVSGRVHGLAITTPGAVLQPAQPALHVVPQDRPLILIARIRPEDIGTLHPGQPVMVQVMVPGMRDRPPIRAHVAQVSADAFDDGPGGARHFRAEITLAQDAQDSLGDRPLLPGMSAELYIETGARTALDYLSEPIRTILRRAWREP